MAASSRCSSRCLLRRHFPPQSGTKIMPKYTGVQCQWIGIIYSILALILLAKYLHDFACKIKFSLEFSIVINMRALARTRARNVLRARVAF